MRREILKKLKSKKGVTLVEVIAAVAILAVVVTAVVAGISFAQRTVLSQGSQSSAAAQAQNLADQLIAKLHGLDESKLGTVSISGAAKIASGSTFPNVSSSQDLQYTVSTVHDNALSGSGSSVSGYRIKVAVAYRDSGGRKFVQMTAFAAKGGDSP
jgi:prepilin-type N-terminal cleavage/methylation domain-containing protein